MIKKKTEKLNEKLFSVKKTPMVLVFFGKYGGCYFSKYFPLVNASKKYFFKKIIFDISILKQSKNI
jgi:hypothetical protein